MRYSGLLGVSLASTVAALSIPGLDLQLPDAPNLSGSTAGAELFLVELAPGQTEWITEERKWALKRVSYHLQSLTDHWRK